MEQKFSLFTLEKSFMGCKDMVEKSPLYLIGKFNTLVEAQSAQKIYKTSTIIIPTY